MNPKSVKIGLLALSLLYAFAAPGALAAEDDDFSRNTLRGLQGVFVLFENLSPELSKAGLSGDQILEVAEGRLHDSGVKVMTLKESFQMKGRPYLEIDVEAMEVSSRSFGYVLEVSLNQEVRMTRISGNLHSQTWRVREIGTVEKDGLPSLVERIGGLVDRFVEAYDSANKGRGNIIRH